MAGTPTRLHHTAYLSKDLEATRAFYEDIVGLPLVATWSEADELFGAISADRQKDAHATLKRWLAGDHTSNNTYR